MDDRPQPNRGRRGSWAAVAAWPAGADPLLKLVDLGLLGTIFVVPYFMGGRYATGQFVFVLLAAATATLWSLRMLTQRRRQWVRTPADWIVPASVALILFQLMPLPRTVLAAVAPKTAAHLPMWASVGDVAGRLGTWDRISLVPQATLGGLAIFMAYGLLFFVVLQRVTRLADVLRILRWIALSTAIMAAFGLLQYLFSNGKFLWVYSHPFRTTSVYVNGSFINRNHFTHLLALGLGAVLLEVVWAFRADAGASRGQPARRQLTGGQWFTRETLWRVALGLVAFAGLMSLSRGGMIVMTLALAVFLAHAYRAQQLGRRLLIGGVAVAAVVVAALSIHGYDRVALRINDVRSASLARLDRHRGRREVWAANLLAIADYPLLGTGVGSHREVHPMYRNDSPRVEYTHAENGYLQIASETGLVGLALLLAWMGVCANWCLRNACRPIGTMTPAVGGRRDDGGGRSSSRHRSPFGASPPPRERSPWPTTRAGRPAQVLLASGAVTAGLAASAVHSLIDFVWYIPACMSITVILAACAARLWQLTRTEIKPETETPVTNGSVTGPRQTPPSHLLAVTTPSLSQPVCLALAGVTLVASLWMVANRLPPALASPAWDRYLRCSLVVTNRQRVKLRQVCRGNVPLDRVAALDPEAGELTAETVTALRQVLAHDPDNARAHVRLAAAYLEQFDQSQRESPNAMDISQIRDAAIASRFPSRGKLAEWLARAFGPSAKLLDKARWHALRGLQLCPLEGEAYLFLAELGFLQGADHPFTVACIDQALRVRPHDERVLFAAGKEAALQGDLVGAVRYWKECFHVGGAYQLQLVRLLASQVPVAFFLQNFEPGLEGLQLLHQFYRQTLQPDEMATFCGYYVETTRVAAAKQPASQAARSWLSASRVCRELGQLDQSLACAEQAQRHAPDDYDVHHMQMTLQLQMGDLVKAEQQLRWCLERKPNDQKLRSLLATTVRRRLAMRQARP